ncbi:hypothetical protein D8674_038150 [Pyrus ussuriensis x Pyrus communis]|uniref:Uncharacterized protein n=1 Tax=Pyrus ussuriensis x Pyrus communis TaxID=2448454 RepID=A0A5N5I8D3_9ROSA|nr:hypothetical protein D8674_038150 [Pyrus ussuriensis x Pyrus communis]
MLKEVYALPEDEMAQQLHSSPKGGIAASLGHSYRGHDSDQGCGFLVHDREAGSDPQS